jgi:hypothetical protein
MNGLGGAEHRRSCRESWLLATLTIELLAQESDPGKLGIGRQALLLSKHPDEAIRVTLDASARSASRSSVSACHACS